MKEACDKNKVCAEILTDLSNALTLLTLKHGLLIAKLPACGFYYKSLIVMLKYLNNSVQVTEFVLIRVKFLIFFGASEGLILGPVLFHIKIVDLFLIEHYKLDFSNCADDTTF